MAYSGVKMAERRKGGMAYGGGVLGVLLQRLGFLGCQLADLTVRSRCLPSNATALPPYRLSKLFSITFVLYFTEYSQTASQP